MRELPSLVLWKRARLITYATQGVEEGEWPGLDASLVSGRELVDLSHLGGGLTVYATVDLEAEEHGLLTLKRVRNLEQLLDRA